MSEWIGDLASSLAASINPAPVLSTIRCVSLALVGGALAALLSVRVEQTKDDGDHDRLLPRPYGAEQVVSGAVPPDTNDPAVGRLDGPHASCIEGR